MKMYSLIALFALIFTTARAMDNPPNDPNDEMHNFKSLEEWKAESNKEVKKYKEILDQSKKNDPNKLRQYIEKLKKDKEKEGK